MTQITDAALSKYIKPANGVVEGSLTEECIFWLCIRYNISIKLDIGATTLSLGERLKELCRFFPKTYHKFQSNQKAILNYIISTQQNEIDALSYRREISLRKYESPI